MKQLMIALRATVVLGVLTGLLYPLAITGLAKLLFPHQANGSMTEHGSEIIGQKFTRPEYIHGRPDGYDGLASGGSNLGPTNAALVKAVQDRIAQFRAENPTYHGPVPADLVTSSGSGLDPDISPEAADAQVARIAATRRAGTDAVRRVIAANTAGPQWGIFGQARVNVLKVNLALDRAIPMPR